MAQGFDLDEVLEWVDRLYEGRDGQRLGRGQVVGRMQQAPLSREERAIFADLPPGPYAREDLRRLVREWAEREGLTTRGS
ncbi:MAG: hypothetical protein IBX62_03025 [Coriobacteriia bacterium]|nr:hypothetical protein [Coriobacteriia bacterium]